MAEHDVAKAPPPAAGGDAAAEVVEEAASASSAQASMTVGDAGTDRVPGWREVLLVAGAVVVGVLALAVLTSLLPTGLQELVFRTPLAIAVLIVVTVGLLVRLGRGSGT